MEVIIELIFDLIFESSKETTKDKKINPWIRIPCLILVLSVSIIVIGGLGFIGINMIIKPTDNTSYIAGGLCLLADLFLIIGTIKEYKKEKIKRLK